MKKYILVGVLALCMVLGGVCASAQHIFGAQEYLVYATVIDDWYADNQARLIVIKGHTALHNSANSLHNELVYVKSEAPDLSQEAINDFVAKNLRSYTIGEFIDQRAEYVILSQGEIDTLFEYKNGWIEFYRQYPDAQGLLTLSRVGTNIAQTQALVYVANEWDLSTGAGVYIILNKDPDGVWYTAREVNVWNSWILD